MSEKSPLSVGVLVVLQVTTEMSPREFQAEDLLSRLRNVVNPEKELSGTSQTRGDLAGI